MKDHKLVPLRPPESILAVVRKAYGNATAYDVGHVWHEIYTRLPDAAPVQEPTYRTDQQIVDQTEELAKFLLSWKYGHVPETDKPMRDAIHPKAEDSWQAACRVQEILTDTDPMNAVAEVDDAPIQEPAPVQEPVHKLVYPGGGKALFNRLWHLTCNAVATQSGMRVRTDVMPMREMKEFLDHLCVLVDSPPQPVPAPVQEQQPAPASKPVLLQCLGCERVGTQEQLSASTDCDCWKHSQPAPVQEPAKKLWLPHGVFPDVADFDADGLPRFYSKESVTKFQGGQCSKPCTGKNCGSMNGWMHSIECRAEHEAVNTAPVQETSTCGRCVVFCQGGDGCLSGMSQITQLGYLTGIN